VKVCASLKPLFPALSPCRARAVYTPSARGAGTTLHEPPEAVVVSVCTRVPDGVRPFQILRVIVGSSPGAVPAAPENVGALFCVELPSAGVTSVTTGGVRSSDVTVKVAALESPVLPDWSTCSARAV
jgi:hypothetical protein